MSREDEIRRVFAKWELDAVEIGRVAPDGVLTARFAGDVVARVPVDLLADGLRYERPTTVPAWLEAKR